MVWHLCFSRQAYSFTVLTYHSTIRKLDKMCNFKQSKYLKKHCLILKLQLLRWWFLFFSVNWFYDFFCNFWRIFEHCVYVHLLSWNEKKTKVYIISIFDARMEAEFSRSWSNNVCYFWNTVAVCFEMLEKYTTYNKTR